VKLFTGPRQVLRLMSGATRGLPCTTLWCEQVEFEIKTKCCKVTVKTQQYINIGILLWQHVSVFLDHFQANIQRYEVQPVHIMQYGIPYYLQAVHRK